MFNIYHSLTLLAPLTMSLKELSVSYNYDQKKYFVRKEVINFFWNSGPYWWVFLFNHIVNVRLQELFDEIACFVLITVMSFIVAQREG